MSSLKSVFAILLSACLLPAANAATIMEELDGANRAFASAIVAGDIDHLVNDYTADGCIIAPSTPETCGAASIRSFWETVIASQPADVQILTQKAGQDGALAYATGELLITDAQAVVHRNRFVLVFKQVAGVWKLHVDSWTPQ